MLEAFPLGRGSVTCTTRRSVTCTTREEGCSEDPVGADAAVSLPRQAGTSRVALVTGGAGCLGSRICRQLAGRGFDVVVGCRVDDERARAVVHRCREAGARAWAWALDLTDAVEVERRLAGFTARFGRLDVLVHAAGAYRLSTVAELRDEDLRTVFSVNTGAAFRLARFASTTMEPDGSVVLVSSLDSERGAAGSAVYSASKAALESLGRVLAVELGARGITVNTVLPGAVGTPVRRAIVNDHHLDRPSAWTPLRRLGSPGDIAATVAWLAGPESRWVTGQSLGVVGGLR